MSCTVINSFLYRFPLMLSWFSHKIPSVLFCALRVLQAYEYQGLAGLAFYALVKIHMNRSWIM